MFLVDAAVWTELRDNLRKNYICNLYYLFKGEVDCNWKLWFIHLKLTMLKHNDLM